MASKPKSIGAFLPDNDNGPSLEDSGIEGREVVISAVSFDNRTGRNGAYTLSVITLDDGSLVHTGSPVVAEQLGPISPNDFPLRAAFVRRPSKNNPRYSYWTLVDPDTLTEG